MGQEEKREYDIQDSGGNKKVKPKLSKIGRFNRILIGIVILGGLAIGGIVLARLNGVGGGSKYTDAKVEKIAKKVLKEKYGEEFIFKSWGPGPWRGTIGIECAPESDPDVLVGGVIDTDDDSLIRDDFLELLMCKKVEVMLEPYINKIWPDALYEALVGSDSSQLDDLREVPRSVTLEQYINRLNKVGSGGIWIYLPEKTLEESSPQKEYELWNDTIIDLMKKNVLPYELTIDVYVLDEALYNSLLPKNLHDTHSTDELFPHNYVSEFEFKYDKDKKILDVSYDEYTELRKGSKNE